MKFLLQLLKDLWASVSHPAQVWAGLKIVLGALWRAFLRVFSPKAPAGQEDDCCLHLDQVYKRADPLIYSQNYLMAKGLSVTWDNPDIQLYEPGPGARGLGAPVDSSALQPDHLYCVRVQVWNGSYSAPAVGMPVTVTFLDFGVGATSHSVGVDVVDLGVKGSSDCPAYAVVDWRTPATAGHYCLQARLEWGDDANPSNNLGQENTNVVTAQSPAHTAFALVNRAATERLFVFEVDAYRLPTLEPCRDTPRRDVSRLEESQARWEAALAKQGLGRFPVPDGWTVELPSDGLVIAPDRETRVEVAIEPPPGTPLTPVNINVFALRPDGSGRDLAGGVTLYVERTP